MTEHQIMLLVSNSERNWGKYFLALILMLKLTLNCTNFWNDRACDMISTPKYSVLQQGMHWLDIYLLQLYQTLRLRSILFFLTSGV